MIEDKNKIDNISYFAEDAQLMLKAINNECGNKFVSVRYLKEKLDTAKRDLDSIISLIEDED